MRIISGLAKGRKLHSPPLNNREIRPSTDRAREALFSMLGDRVRGSRVLDLFAGTGAIGCEALSRGADHVTFVDISRKSLSLISRNVALIPGASPRCTIIKHDLRRSLPRALRLESADRLFDLVFADPPYLKGYSEKILHFLDNSAVLSRKVLVIIEEQKQLDLDLKLKQLVLTTTRNYGDTCFSFFKHSKSSLES